jgi:hypothetical protein
MDVPCKSCGAVQHFEQPYAYHAGFGNQGFLYNKQGNLTLVWSSFDPAYERIVGGHHPWALSKEQRVKIEGSLAPAPSGGNWLFKNPACCTSCHSPISGPITETIYYLSYQGSLVLDAGPNRRSFSEVLRSAL